MGKRSAEFPRYVEWAERLTKEAGIGAVPLVHELAAAIIEAAIEDERSQIHGKLLELAESVNLLSKTDIERVAYDVKHADRDQDGEFGWGDWATTSEED